LRLHHAAGGETLKKEKVTVSIDGGPEVPFPSKAAEKEIAEKIVKPIVQTNLQGGEVPVEKDYETKNYEIWTTPKLTVKFGEESLEKVRGMKGKDQTKTIARKIRIKADADELLPGEYDRESKQLIAAVQKGY